MRRFSQRNALVTLSDINITPLLDLAFVLLIIFVITTPLLEQSIKLDLPKGGRPEKALTKDDIRVVEVSREGYYVLKGQRLTLSGIERALVTAHRANPNLVVLVRADYREQFGYVADLFDRCTRNGITKVSIATQPEKR
ncbi:MAG: biopolymer transporter ExbD [Verrucomicrobia bacterium]|nr:biopolymer transporter ExbD [Verrucomicrobiota bacterium]